ncbi:MAG: carboxypeptidase-like regulatory domain-containing protein [Gemmatimonadales bacterium]
MDYPCPTPQPEEPPAPPPPPPPPPPPAGTSGIEGRVYDPTILDRPNGLANWVIEISGPVTATATTNASGNYVFSGLPAGTYTICEVQQTGWSQVFPRSGTQCPPGLGIRPGYTFPIADANIASFVNFGNVVTP